MSTVYIINTCIKTPTVHFSWCKSQDFYERSTICCFFIKTWYDFSVEVSHWRWNKSLADSYKF